MENTNPTRITKTITTWTNRDGYKMTWSERANGEAAYSAEHNGYIATSYSVMQAIADLEWAMAQ